MKVGTRLFVVQKAKLATHLQLVSKDSPRALCGADPGLYPSYCVVAVVRPGGRLEYLHDGFGCLHHVDCKRCHAIYSKKKPLSPTPNS